MEEQMEKRLGLVYKILMWFFWTVLVIMITICFCDVVKVAKQNDGNNTYYEYNY